MEKICTICKEKKDICEFNKWSQSKDGYFYICRECDKQRKKMQYDNGYKNRMKELRIINNEHIKNYDKKYRTENKDKINLERRNRYKNNPQHNLKVKLRSRIRAALLGKVKSKHTMELLGCDIIFFQKYFEDLFTEGMCWEKVYNGEIHIDHIIPCDAFDLTNIEEQMLCFNYKNLQPLWHKDNLRKGVKIQ